MCPRVVSGCAAFFFLVLLCSASATHATASDRAQSNSRHATSPERPWVTVFTTLRKPALVQRAALLSYTLLRPQPEILIFADEGDEATEKLAAEFGCRVLYLTDRSPQWHKPYIDTLFATARREAQAEYLLFANADIVLTQDVIDVLGHMLALLGPDANATAPLYRPFFELRQELDLVVDPALEPLLLSSGKPSASAPKAHVTYLADPPADPTSSSGGGKQPGQQLRAYVDRPAFVLTGQRWSLGPEALPVTAWVRLIGGEPDWLEHLKSFVTSTGRPGLRSAMDYFLYPRHLNLPMPRYLVGLPRWDSWILDYCIKNGIPFVDASEVVFAVHKDHPSTWTFKSASGEAMKKLTPDMEFVYIDQSSWRLRPCDSPNCSLPISLSYREPPPCWYQHAWLVALALLVGGFVAWRYQRQLGRLAVLVRAHFHGVGRPPSGKDLPRFHAL